MSSPRAVAIGVVAMLACLVVAWQAYIWVGHIPFYVLPDPAQTAQAIAGNLSLLAEKSLVTLEGAALGLAAAVALAVSLALVIERWPPAEHVIVTYSLLVRTLPIVGVAPIVILVSGRGLATSVLCVMVITVFSLLVSVSQGFSSIPKELNELSDLYAAPFARRLRVTMLPSAVPSLLQGLRLAAPVAVLGALLAEWLDGFGGVGTLIITAQADQEVQLLMAACLAAVCLSLVAYGAVEVGSALAGRRGYRVDEIAIGGS